MPNQHQDWTPEEIETLKAHHRANKSAADISKLLGTNRSRNAILGKIHRLGLAVKQTTPRSKDFRHRPDKTAKAKQAKQNPSLPAVVRSVPPKRIIPLVAPAAQKLTVLQLTDKTCRWPIGDPSHKDFHFCGHGPRSGSPYCEFHATQAVQPLWKAHTGERKAHVMSKRAA